MPEKHETQFCFVRLLMCAHKLTLVSLVNDANVIVSRYFIGLTLKDYSKYRCSFNQNYLFPVLCERRTENRYFWPKCDTNRTMI